MCTFNMQLTPLLRVAQLHDHRTHQLINLPYHHPDLKCAILTRGIHTYIHPPTILACSALGNFLSPTPAKKKDSERSRQRMDSERSRQRMDSERSRQRMDSERSRQKRIQNVTEDIVFSHKPLPHEAYIRTRGIHIHTFCEDSFD